jgi:hypothetical protein
MGYGKDHFRHAKNCPSAVITPENTREPMTTSAIDTPRQVGLVKRIRLGAALANNRYVAP